MSNTPDETSSVERFSFKAGSECSSSEAGESTSSSFALMEQQQPPARYHQEVKEVEEAEVAQVCTIKTRRGAEVVTIPIPCTN